MTIRLTPNYPETPPEIQLHRKSGIQSSQVSRIQESLMSKAKDCLGAEMIYDLIEHARVPIADAIALMADARASSLTQPSTRCHFMMR